MEQALAALGMLFMLFLVVATASEQIVETFRGLLQAAGIKILKGGVTVAEATRLSAEFLPAGSLASAKADALLAVARDYPRKLEGKLAQIERAKAGIDAALMAPLPEARLVEQATAAVNALALEVSGIVEKTEQVRVMVLRVLSLVVCLAISLATHFNALDIVAEAYPAFFGTLRPGAGGNLAFWQFTGVLATALAASAGSSYWHDQLDKVRAVKTAITSIKTAAG